VATEGFTEQIDLDNREAALLVGTNDAHLRTLEDLLDCDICLRGNRLRLEGTADEVARGRALVEELRSLLRSGEGFDKATLELAASLSAGSPPHEWTRDLENIVGDVILEHRGRRIRPKTVNQKAYVDAIRTNTITFGIGPAGTGKTYLAMAMATKALLSGDVARIILTRPAVEAGEKLGFLPGGLMEKVDPYLRPCSMPCMT
jgi:phosphate starvation-inducible PhoH-like protein